MPESSLHLSKPTLAYAKLVATPTETSWSQVYNAGNLFACVSLTIKEETDETVSLASTGKSILDTLQAEFFVLEEKSLSAIKDVIQKCLHDRPDYLTIAMTVGFFKDSVLYIFIVGEGRVIMKRHGNTGVLLEQNESSKGVSTASGYLQNEDTVVLETKPFAKDINDETLATALELSIPNDIAEALSPQLHAKEDGGQAAIIIMYHGASKSIAPEQISIPEKATLADFPEREGDSKPFEAFSEGEEEQQPELFPVEQEELEENTPVSRPGKKLSLPHLPALDAFKEKLPAFSGFKLSHRRKLFLSIIVILVVLLSVSIFFTKKKEADTKQQELFKQVYEPALNKYESAKALETLNKDVSYGDYLEAKKMLTDNSNKFPAGSPEAKQMQELLAKIEKELNQESPVESANAKEASVGENSYLAVAKANKDAKGLTQDDTAVYYLTDKAIVSVAKNSGAKKELVKNNNTWTDAVGLATYLGNLYVLDRKKGIMKFASGDYAQSSYFKDKPDLSSAQALAIDSAIWILLKDGTILKYTSGVSDGYKAPKLAKALSNPTKIFTDANTSNIYILDRGTSRIMKIPKEGATPVEYASPVIKSARDFEVKEKDKKILILSGDKVYEIAL